MSAAAGIKHTTQGACASNFPVKIGCKKRLIRAKRSPPPLARRTHVHKSAAAQTLDIMRPVMLLSAPAFFLNEPPRWASDRLTSSWSRIAERYRMGAT